LTACIYLYDIFHQAHKKCAGKATCSGTADDVDGFAERTIAILHDPGLGSELGKKARETVQEKFLITRVLSDYLDLLNDLSQ